MPMVLHSPGDSVNGIRGHFLFSLKNSQMHLIFSNDCPFISSLAQNLSVEGKDQHGEHRCQGSEGVCVRVS